MANLKSTGIVFDIQSLSFHDGPGIRTLIFLKGCPLKCLWCANPEGQKTCVEVRYHSTKCNGCLECAKVCGKHAITPEYDEDKKVTLNINREKCDNCNQHDCVEACCNAALSLTGKTMTVEQVMRLVKRDLPYYRGKGGVTLSGGDPTYQNEFALEILKACQEEYVNTAIESAMFTNEEIVDAFIPYTDLFLTDIKHMDSNKHKELTGVDNEVVLKNIQKIAKHKPLVVRFPIIPGFNDDEENILTTAKFCLENNITRINILPYHKLGQIKYNQLGLEYKMSEVSSPDNSKMDHIKDLIESIGITCVI